MEYSDCEKLQKAKDKMAQAYKKYNDHKKHRKIIVVTTQHIEDNIAFRKRRVSKV